MTLILVLVAIVLVAIIGQLLAARYGDLVGLVLVTVLEVLPVVVFARREFLAAQVAAAAPLCQPWTPGCEMAGIGVAFSYLAPDILAGLAILFVAWVAYQHMY